MNPDGDLIMGMRRSRFLLVLMCVLLGLWIAFAKLVVPLVIESAYRNESLPVLNSLMVGRATHSVDEYLRDWEQFAGGITVASIGFGLLGLVLFMVTTSPTFFRRFVGEATPGTLGAMRVWVCGILLLLTLLEDLPSIAWLPIETRQPQGVMRWLYILPIGFDKLVASAAGLYVFQLLTELLLFLGMIGWGTRLVIPLGAVCFFLLAGVLRDYSFNWHQGWVPLYLITILSFTPCGDGWSVDRLLKVFRGRPVPDSERPLSVYGWSRYACWVAIALTYWETGLCKLRDGGMAWWNPIGLRGAFYQETLMPREFNWSWSLYLTQAPDALIALSGLMALVLESVWIIVLFSSTSRKIVPVLTILMHTGIAALMRILFIDLILIQFLFFDFAAVRRAIARRLETIHSRIQVLYDGHCPLCNRTVRVLRFFDLFTRLEFLDFRRLDLADYNRRHELALTIQDLDREMYVISRGQAHIGYYGYRVLALALPAFWPLWPLLFFPGVSWVGERVYGYIAHNRLALLKCDAHCPSMPLGASNSPVLSQTSDRPQRFGYAFIITGFSVVAAISFFYRVEFYPLTSWHLFSGLGSSTAINYYKVLGHQASGTIVPVRLEDAIGALGWDSRYVRELKQCFGAASGWKFNVVEKDVDVCNKFLIASGSVYNEKSPPDRKITHVEIQEWVWDFRSNPSDPEHGKVTDHVIVEIKPVTAAAKKEIRETY
jgi:predicted DCC family thiol-disulfide oxidoreductase YuxK